MQRYKIADMIPWKFYGGHDIHIVPIFDVHLGAENCMEDEFRAFVEEIADTPNTYVVIGGDLVDNGLKNSLTNVYRQLYKPSTQKREMANILEKIKHRCLCLVSGNHERRSVREVDDSPLRDIASKLDLEKLFREDIAFLHIYLGKERYNNGHETAGKDRPSYTCAVCHGSGGGMLTGGAVNRVERFPHDADLLITGHTHAPFETYPTRVTMDTRNDAVYCVSQTNVKATSWLRYGDYAAQKMLRPTSFIRQRITLSGSEKKITVVSEI